MTENEIIRHRRRSRKSQGRNNNVKSSHVTQMEDALMLLAWHAGQVDEARVACALGLTAGGLRTLSDEKVDEGARICRALAEPHDKRLAQIERLRSKLAKLEAEAGIHSSDCAVHNEPAYPAGECDCGLEHDDE